MQEWRVLNPMHLLVLSIFCRSCSCSFHFSRVHTTVQLKHNYLSDFPAGFFAGLTRLTSFYVALFAFLFLHCSFSWWGLTYASLKGFPSESFSHLISLRSLFVTWNVFLLFCDITSFSQSCRSSRYSHSCSRICLCFFGEFGGFVCFFSGFCFSLIAFLFKQENRRLHAGKCSKWSLPKTRQCKSCESFFCDSLLYKCHLSFSLKFTGVKLGKWQGRCLRVYQSSIVCRQHIIHCLYFFSLFCQDHGFKWH